MGSDINFKHESVQDLDSLLKYLKAVTEGLEKGKIRLSTKNKELVLEPRGLVKFDVEAKRKGDFRKFSLKFSWKDEEDPAADEEPLVVEPS